jgi:hypothetical protein
MASPRHHNRGIGSGRWARVRQGRRPDDTQEAFGCGLRARHLLFKRAAYRLRRACRRLFGRICVRRQPVGRGQRVPRVKRFRAGQPLCRWPIQQRAGLGTGSRREAGPSGADPQAAITPSATRRPDPPPRTIRTSPILSNRSVRSSQATPARPQTPSTPSRSAPTICSTSSAD